MNVVSHRLFFRQATIGAALGLALSAFGQSDASDLRSYANCTFSDGLMVVKTDPLPPGVTSRSVDTDEGIRHVHMEAGVRIMFAYPLTDFYANVKAERIPSDEYKQAKQDLLANFAHLAHTNIINTSQPSPLYGFEIHGLDRDKLEGGVLGIYLLFRDQEKTVTTIYLLNQDPTTRKFQSLEEYRSLRDRFLNAYTACISSNLGTK